jgi:hypothetical protein
MHDLWIIDAIVKNIKEKEKEKSHYIENVSSN